MLTRRAFGRSSDEFCLGQNGAKPVRADTSLIHGIRINFGAAVRGAAAAEHGMGGRQLSASAQMMLFCLDAAIRAETLYYEENAVSPRHTASMGLLRWLHTRGTPWPDAVGPLSGEIPKPTGWLIQDGRLFAQQDSDLVCEAALKRFGAEAYAGSFQNRVNDARTPSALQRSIALAVWSDATGDVFEQAVANSLITHGHGDAYLSAGAFAVVINVVLRGGDLADAVEMACEELIPWAGHETVRRALTTGWELGGAREPWRLSDGFRSQEAPEVLAVVIAAARMRWNDFEQAIGLALETCPASAALVGAVLGAAHGDSAVQTHWLTGLELRDVIDRLAADLVAATVGSGERVWERSWVADYPSF